MVVRITVTPLPRDDGFTRVADDMGGFTRGDATQGFSRAAAPTGAPEGSPAIAPTPEPAPTSDTGGFSRVPNTAVADTFKMLPDQPEQPFTTPAGTFTPLSGGPSRTPWFDKALEPITSYPATQRRMAGEGVEQMKSGVAQIGTKGERTKGFFNTALGALNYTFSPINAAAHTIVGKPLEENTGLPHQYSEFATTLALPGIGFGKVPKGVQKIFSPETVSQEAMDAAALIRRHSGIAARDTETTAAQLESYAKDVSKLTSEEQLGIMHYIEGRRPVDVEGYHGTTAVFDKFDPAMRGASTEAPSAKKGFFFSKDPKTADVYTGKQYPLVEDLPPVARAKVEALQNELSTAMTGTSTRSHIENLREQIAAIFRDPAHNVYSHGSNVRPSRVQMMNPLVHDFKGAEFRDIKYDELIKRAQAAGHDGVILKNTRDGGPVDDIYVAFHPDQIGSKFGPGPRAPGNTNPNTAGMRALADTLKQAFAERLTKLQALPQHAQMDFVENYFPHFWKNPDLAKAITTSGGFSKQGSGASLKARTVPTIEEGIKQGLEPLTTNPIDATMHYITSMDKFIAAQEILNTAIKDGTIIYRRPTVMGASGHSNSLQGVPPGYVALKGRGSKDATGATAYAPEDWARIYNNNISRGWADVGEEYGNAYAKAQVGANAITQTLLSFSGYHAFTMAEAGMSNQIAKSIEAINAGKPFEAVKEFAKTPLAPIAYAFKGAKLRDVYLGKLAARSPEEKEIVDLITQAGGRMAKQPKLADYDSSALGDYLTSFRRGKLAAEFKAQGQDIAGAPIGGTFRTAASNIGRVMDTFNKPLFQHYIPSMKNAAASENLSQWLRLNPTASQAEKLASARKIVDSVDNRFGEMIQDNIFWNKVAKQSAMLAMLSYSWNVGGWRELGGGVRDIARAGVGQSGWTPKASYVVATALNWAIMSASYQYMKTGEAPKDIHDLVAPRTGGVDARTGQDERIIPPGIMKDVFGYYEHFGQEVMNKMNPGLRLAGQSASILGGQGGQDWRGDPILSPKGPGETALSKVPDWLAEYFSFVIKGMSPIQSQQLGRGPEEGSALNPLELGLGIRKAPRQLTDPEGYEIMLNKIHRDAWRRKLLHDKRETERYKGGSE